MERLEHQTPPGAPFDLTLQACGICDIYPLSLPPLSLLSLPLSLPPPPESLSLSLLLSFELSSLPLSSLELASLPLSSFELASLLLPSLELSSLPLSSFELPSFEFASLPLLSLELASFELALLLLSTPVIIWSSRMVNVPSALISTRTLTWSPTETRSLNCVKSAGSKYVTPLIVMVSSVIASTIPTISMPESFVFSLILVLFPVSTMKGVTGEPFTLELSPVAGVPLQALRSIADRVRVNKIKRAVFLVFMVYLCMVWFHPSSRQRRVKVTGFY